MPETNRTSFGHICAGVLAAIAAVGGAAHGAEGPLSGSEFEAYAEGRTLFFYSQGQAYGAERYLPGRKVEWSFLDGECQNGEWYESGSSICFVYEYRPDTPQCWTFYKEGDRLRALFDGGAGETELYEANETQDEMICLGPQIGV